MENFSIVLDGDIEGTFQRSRYLEEIVEIQHYLKNSGDFDSSLSVADSLALLNSAVNDSGILQLPDDEEVLAELTNLINRDQISGYVSADFSQARIVVRHNLGSSYELNQALISLQSFITEHTDEGLHVNITGESILTSQAADQMAAGQAKSLGLMLLMIFVVISLLFLNPKAGLLAIVPNLLPIVILFGVMGFVGIPLDSGTSMIAVIALGICVDNTMHFMVRYNRELARQKDQTKAIYNTMRGEAIPITAATIALSLGLGVLVFSSFTPVAYFGVLSGMVILLAYYANFFITPILLSSTRLITLWDLLSVELRRELINNCSLFRGMQPRQVKRVILMSEVREYPAGEAIMHNEEHGNEMFVLLEGKGEILTLKSNLTPDSIIPIETGHVFGLTNLLSRRPSLTRAITLEDCKVLVLTWNSIQRHAWIYPRSTCLLFQNLTVMFGARFADLDLTSRPIPSNQNMMEIISTISIPEASTSKPYLITPEIQPILTSGRITNRMNA